ncbi:fatty acid desaturase [Chromobacterium sp. ATCC 53434]|uniref:fatty acid desaturase family protein n=1 Tax=Chromobacterium TaxID=535 RepID=UPI000C791EFC|nr:fatty acid desaturase [Chromobacterium sp. ATCC 53434]AUH50252.1 fatty acid desaturase [Chromobacterium sp. ATCC 53434]
MQKEQWLAVRQQYPNGRKGPWTVLLWLADIAVIGGAWAAWNAEALALRLIALPLAALALMQLYLIMHEACHGVVSQNRFVNDLVGHVCSWFIGLPYLVRRQNHLAHHAWTGHPVNDTETRAMIARFSVMTEKEEKRLEWMWKLWIPMIALNHFRIHWVGPFRARHVPGNRVRLQRFFNCLYAAGYAALIAAAVHYRMLGMLAGFCLPIWLFLLTMVEMLNLPHHAEAPILSEDHPGLRLWEQDAYTHDCAAVPLWSRFLILNFNLHIAHHAFPWLPWHQLAKADAMVAAMRQAPQPERISEVTFALRNRRRPLLSMMGHFFDKRGRSLDAAGN